MSKPKLPAEVERAISTMELPKDWTGKNPDGYPVTVDQYRRIVLDQTRKLFEDSATKPESVPKTHFTEIGKDERMAALEATLLGADVGPAFKARLIKKWLGAQVTASDRTKYLERLLAANPNISTDELVELVERTASTFYGPIRRPAFDVKVSRLRTKLKIIKSPKR